MIGTLHDHYTQRAAAIAARDSPAGQSPDAADWDKQRPEIYRRLMASLGLEALPPRCDLRATETGSFSGTGYRARKIAYQLLPDCWGSAHLYRPDNLPDDQPTPAVLYTCGHKPAGVVGYQHHAVAWARRGYTCLVFDTLEQHDNPGEHHGLHPNKTPEWIAMGYTAAGGEVFNGMRALDLLLAQPGVDRQRVGVTGISGGGAQSFLLAAADDRLRAVATVAGISTPEFAIPNRQVQQHCDCMYHHNRYGHDVSLFAALIAPRALLYCFARHDSLYTPEEFRAVQRRTRDRFERLGCGDRCELYEFDGPHGYNHRHTTDAIHRWFDRHVAGQTHPEVDTLAIATESGIGEEAAISTFHGQTPQPNYLDMLPRLLSPRGQIRLPECQEQWPAIRQAAIGRLRAEVFHLLDDVRQPQELEPWGQWNSPAALDRDAWRGRLDGTSQMIVQTAPADDRHQAVIVALGQRDDQALRIAGQLREAGGREDLSVLALEPRFTGFAAFPEAHRNQLNREGCLVGLTPTMVLMQDLHHLWPKLKAMPRVAGRKLYLYGKGEGAIAMLYHALLQEDPDIAGIILEDLPSSHADTPHQVLGIQRVMDLPHAIGLLAPMRVALVNPGGIVMHWYWAARAHQRMTRAEPAQASNIAAALEQIVPK